MYLPSSLKIVDRSRRHGQTREVALGEASLCDHLPHFSKLKFLFPARSCQIGDLQSFTNPHVSSASASDRPTCSYVRIRNGSKSISTNTFLLKVCESLGDRY